jgi:hypothetical protein
MGALKFVRGVPYEVLPANSNPVRMNERHWEAPDLIVKCWTHHDSSFNHEGRFFPTNFLFACGELARQ